MLAITDLLYMAAMPVVDIFLMASIGFFITRKGIMDGRIRQGLSQILFWVFIPCLTFSKIGTSLNFEELAVWWILPVNMAYSIGIGLVVGYISAKLLKVEPWFCKLEMCVIALGNVGNLPIVLVQSICANDNTLFSRALPNGLCQERGIAYVAFAMWIASTFQFCVAINLMAKKDPSPATPSQKLERHQSAKVPEIAIEMTSNPLESESQNAEPQRSEAFQEGDNPVQIRQDDEGNDQKLFAIGHSEGKGATRVAAASSLGDLGEGETRTRAAAAAAPLGDLADGNDQALEETAGLLNRREASAEREALQAFDSGVLLEGVEILDAKTSSIGSKRRRYWMRISQGVGDIRWSRYFNMPTIAALAGLSVGCISVLKDLLFGDAAPLGFLSQSITIMSGGMIPTMMLVLGSGLSKGPGNTGLPVRVIIGTVLVRLMIIPAIGYASVLAAQHVGLFHSPNPLFTLVLLMCHTTPTALNLQTVAVLNQNGEAEIAALICWQYIASLVAVPLWMAVFISTLS